MCLVNGMCTVVSEIIRLSQAVIRLSQAGFAEQHQNQDGMGQLKISQDKERYSALILH
jgi:hypothetical protein